MKIENAKTRHIKEQDSAKENKSQRVSAYTESYKGEYYNIDIAKLIPFKDQARKHFDEKALNEMASTIKEHGIRQPLTVLPSEQEEGKYEIISGERRWKAAKIVGLSKVPCILVHNRDSAREIALIENVQRKNLHPLELMKGFQNLLDQKICKNHQDIANKIGVSRTIVVETINLSQLAVSTQNILLDKGIKSRSVLRNLLKSPQQEHEHIIKEAIHKQSIQKNKPAKRKERKNKLLAIYLENEEITFDSPKNLILSVNQKKQIVNYLNEVINKL